MRDTFEISKFKMGSVILVKISIEMSFYCDR